MTFKISDLNFNVELSSSMARASQFPRDNCAGIALLRPDEKIRKYKLKLWLDADTCEKAKMKPTGFVMVRISDCSSALQILYQEKQGDNFKGYVLRASGGYKTNKQLATETKKTGRQYYNCYVELTVNFDEIDTKKTNKFNQEFVDILHVAKHQVVLDISKIRLHVNK